MKYRVGKSNKKALLKEESGHEIALFQSEFLANRCAELLNQQSVNSSLRLYSDIMAHYIKRTKFGDFVISDYKGCKVADVRREHQLLAHEIQRVLSYDIISKLSVAEIKKVITVKTKYKIKAISQFNGEETYKLYKDTLFDYFAPKIIFTATIFSSLVLLFIYLYGTSMLELKIVFSIGVAGFWTTSLNFIRYRYEEQTLPTECTYDKQKLNAHIEMLKQRTIKNQLKKLLLSKTIQKRVEL